MHSITLKRAAATVAVVAGLLAAAAPASAQSLPGMVGFTPPIGTDKGSLTAAQQGTWGPIVYVGGAGLGIDAGPGDDNITTAAGTQVGSEGVKRNGRGFFDIPAELRGSISGEEMTKAIVSVKAPGSANVPAQLSIGTAEVFELNTFGGNDTLRANSGEVAAESVTHVSEHGWGTTYLNAKPTRP